MDMGYGFAEVGIVRSGEQGVAPVDVARLIEKGRCRDAAEGARRYGERIERRLCMARVWSWDTRDSDTPSCEPISRRVWPSS